MTEDIEFNFYVDTSEDGTEWVFKIVFDQCVDESAFLAALESFVISCKTSEKTMFYEPDDYTEH